MVATRQGYARFFPAPRFFAGFFVGFFGGFFGGLTADSTMTFFPSQAITSEWIVSRPSARNLAA